VGDRVTVFDGRGREATGTLITASGRSVSIKLGPSSQSPAPLCAITLGQAVPKGKNMELIVQKAVELGAASIVPLLSDRTIVQVDASDLEKKRRKWGDVALEACKQCGQNFLPEIQIPVSPKTFFQSTSASELLLIASLQPGSRSLKSVLAEFSSTHQRLPKSVTVLVGPEGDFTPAEIALARSHGCQPITLGPIILRTETAAIYCLSVLAHELYSG